MRAEDNEIEAMINGGCVKPYYQDDYVTIYHGDCCEMLAIVPDNSVDLVLTDPPYSIFATSCGFDGGQRFLDTVREAGLHEGFDFGLLDVFIEKLKSPNIISFCNQSQFSGYLNWIEPKGYSWRLLSWHKPGCIPLRHHYRSDTEYIFHIWANMPIRGGYKPTYFIHKVNRNGFNHPTVKPVDIVSKLILGATDKGQTVLDPFLGSGTTACCAKKLGRRAVGFEISEQYAEIAARRCSQQAFDFVTDSDKKCYVCGGPVHGRGDAKFCSTRCKQKAYRQRQPLRVAVTDKEAALV